MSMLVNVRGNRLFLLILALQCTSVVWAQDASELPTPDVKSIIAAPEYTSVFEKYRLYSGEEVGSWKQANDTVKNNGGWKAYAKEVDPALPAPSNNGHSTTHHEGTK